MHVILSPSWVSPRTRRTTIRTTPPIAVTDQDQMVSAGDLVTLNGSGSFDPDGEIVSYAWGIEDSDDDAPSVLLGGRDTSVATFTAPKVVGDVNANSYLFELTVTDNDGLKATNTSKVVVRRILVRHKH